MNKIKVATDYVTFTEEEKQNMIKCLENHDTSIFAGDTISNFEEKVSKYLDVNYCVAMPNCTLSLYSVILSLNMSNEDEVIVPNLTHASSIYPVILSEVKIKCVDFEKDSYNYDLKHLEKLITTKTKAILVCYLYGLPLNILEIKKLADKKGIPIIEDTAQAFGLKIKGKYAGTFGEMGCLSFNDTKMLRIGEGGAIITNKKSNYDKLNLMRHVGEGFKTTNLTTVGNNVTYGELLNDGLINIGKALNFRPSPITFATGEIRIDKVKNVIRDRIKKLTYYYDNLSNEIGLKFIDNFNIKEIDSLAPISAWIILNPKIYNRNKLIIGCLNMGIPVGSFNYPTIASNEFFSKYVVNKEDEMNNSNNIRDNSIFLPLYENIDLNQVNQIISAFKYVLEKYKNNEEDDIFNEELYLKSIDYFDGFYTMKN